MPKTSIFELEHKISVLQSAVNSLLPYKIFFNHLKAHGAGTVHCDVCHKTFEQILSEVNQG